VRGQLFVRRGARRRARRAWAAAQQAACLWKLAAPGALAPGALAPPLSAVFRCCKLQISVLSAAEELRVHGREEPWRMALAGGFDLLAVAPVRAAGGVVAAPVGLVNMLNAGGAVEEWALGAGARGGGATARLLVRSGGEFLMHASAAPARVLVRGAAAEFEYAAGTGALTFALPAEGGMKAEVEVAFA
jgi:hypothetical protein